MRGRGASIRSRLFPRFPCRSGRPCRYSQSGSSADPRLLFCPPPRQRRGCAHCLSGRSYRTAFHGVADEQHHAVERAREDAVEDDRTRNREDLRADAEDQPLCLCQDRTHIFLFFSNYRIQSNGNQLFLLKGLSSGLPCNCFYDFLGEIIMTPEVNLYSSIFIDTDLLYQFPKFFWAVPIQKLNTLGICF